MINFLLDLVLSSMLFRIIKCFYEICKNIELIVLNIKLCSNNEIPSQLPIPSKIALNVDYIGLQNTVYFFISLEAQEMN